MVCHPQAVEINSSVYWAPSPMATTTASSSNPQSLAHWASMADLFPIFGCAEACATNSLYRSLSGWRVDCRVSGLCQLKFLCHTLTPCHLLFTRDNHKYYSMYLPSWPLSVSTTRFLHLISQLSNFYSRDLSSWLKELKRHSFTGKSMSSLYVDIEMGWYQLDSTWTTPDQDTRCVKEFWTESEYWSLYSYLYTVLTTGQSNVMMVYLTSNYVPLGYNTGNHLKRLPVPERSAGISYIG
jgi:hypothetical protein